MIAAVLGGLLIGIISSSPFLLNGYLTKRMLSKGQNMTLSILIIEVIGSFIVMSIGIAFTALIAREAVLPFSVTMLGTFMALVLVGVLLQSKKLPKGKSSAKEQE